MCNTDGTQCCCCCWVEHVAAVAWCICGGGTTRWGDAGLLSVCLTCVPGAGKRCHKAVPDGRQQPDVQAIAGRAAAVEDVAARDARRPIGGRWQRRLLQQRCE